MRGSEDTIYLAALSACERLGSLTIQELLKLIGEAKLIWQMDTEELRSRGVPEKICENIDWWRKRFDPEKNWAKAEKLGLRVFDFREEDYPGLLREIPDVPVVLYVKGEWEENETRIGVVGSRAVSPYGEKVTEMVAMDLVKAGVTIVSGLALGVDGVSQKVAVGNRARTVAVVAHGLDKICPTSHENLANKIVEYGGAVISEYPPGDFPLKHHFLERNRIIAGLSMGTLVVEAAEKSGALTTARCALEYGRTVYAVPGDVFRRQSVGTNNLIKYGATPVVKGEDILNDLNLGLVKPVKEIELTEDERRIMELLEEPRHIDEMANLLEISVSTLSVILLSLEMRGVVKNAGGMNFIRNVN